MGSIWSTDSEKEKTAVTNLDGKNQHIKIVKLELLKIEIEFVAPYHLSMGTFESKTNCVAKIFTNTGVIGYGEADPLSGFSDETNETVFEIVEGQIWPLIRQKNPLEISQIDRLLDSNIQDNVMAKGMINMALWDIFGKVHQKPVYECLGNGKIHSSLALLYPFSDQSADEDFDLMEGMIEKGYRTFMLKMGSERPIQDQIERVKRLHESKYGPVGGNIHVIPDANQGFSIEQAYAYVEGVKDVPLDFVEQPFQKQMLEETKKLQEFANPLKISLDESISTYESAKYVIENQIARAISIKVSKNGGISKLFAMGELAKRHDVNVYFNSMLEYGISQAALFNVAVSTPNIVPIGQCFMSTLRFKDDITDFGTHIKDAVVTLWDNTHHGLGVNVDEEKLKKYTTEVKVLE